MNGSKSQLVISNNWFLRCQDIWMQLFEPRVHIPNTFCVQPNIGPYDHTAKAVHLATLMPGKKLKENIVTKIVLWVAVGSALKK